VVFVVAEIGVNWDGDYELVQEMIQESKKTGCNAVKFQSFNEELIKNHPEKSRLMKSSISKNNVEKINQIATEIGIEWFSTPMYPEAVDILNPFVKRFKIREFDGRNLIENKTTELFKKIQKTDKEIIVSTQSSPKNSEFYNDSNINWLYCVPKYPCDLEDLDFTNFNEFDGYSNHSPNIIAPLTAVILGSKIVEIHITSNKNKNFIDNNVSFDYKSLSNLVQFIRDAEKIKR